MERNGRTRSPSLPRRLAVLATAAAAIALLPSLAEAVATDGDPQAYTGCLVTSGSGTGSIKAVAAGSRPTRACQEHERRIDLNNGDITRVVGGHGITTGVESPRDADSTGPVTLDLEPGYRLPQACRSGQVPLADGRGQWVCGVGYGRVIVGAAIAKGGRQSLFANFRPLGKPATLPAGTWAVTAKALLSKEGSSRTYFAHCQLVGGGRAIDRQMVVVMPSWAEIVLVGAFTTNTPTSVTLECHDAGGDGAWDTTRIVAVATSEVENQNLSP